MVKLEFLNKKLDERAIQAWQEVSSLEDAYHFHLLFTPWFSEEEIK